MRLARQLALSLLFVAGVAGTTGCEIISSVDRSKIGEGSGGDGGGGGGGGGPECTTPAGCPTPASECEVATCDGGACGTAPVDSGTPVATQAVGDCQTIVCDGDGGTTTVPDDADLPADDGLDCTIEGCDMGAPTSTPAAQATACDDGGGALCDGQGSCVECLAGGDCPDGVCFNNACQTATCMDGVANGGETDVDCGGPCGGCADGEMCGDGADCLSGVCTGNLCTTGCGDGVVNGSEVCDDGNNDDCDGCRGDCSAVETGCGDGFQCLGEGCDDGNLDDGDGCDSNCMPTGCGNGIVTAPEVCDDGNQTNGDGCDNNCTPTGCGNGVTTAGEECDDGNLDNTDGCLNTCVAATCGDSIVRAGVEECDDGNADNTDGCLNTCELAACGDGFLQAGVEECDDGNTVDGDCCSAMCELESGCIQETEPNSTCAEAEGPYASIPSFTFYGSLNPAGDQDFFSFTVPAVANLRIETFAGAGANVCTTGNDTLIQLRGSDCATVLLEDDDAGIGNCSLINPTTDAVARQVAPGTYYLSVEEYDNNDVLNNYRAVVTLTSLCGNGALETFEGCDDGNLTGGDGCSASCTVEQGYVCAGDPSVCMLSCGDGVINGTDQCDDGNLDAGDGCSATCTIEAGYVCAGAPSVCALSCGDGVINGMDQCDDGNAVGGDGCSATCQIETDFQCTDPAPSVCSMSETNCNDGLDDDGDGMTDLDDPDCALGAALITPCGAGEALYVYSSVNVPRAIPDPGTTTSVVVATHPGVIQRAAMRLSILHTYNSDLDLLLSSPLGPTLDMSIGNGGLSDNYTDTLFDSTCATPITSGTGPFTGCFRPEQSLAGFNGQDAMGTWTLTATDFYEEDPGTLTDWSIALCVTP